MMSPFIYTFGVRYDMLLHDSWLIFSTKIIQNIARWTAFRPSLLRHTYVKCEMSIPDFLCLSIMTNDQPADEIMKYNITFTVFSQICIS